MRTRLRRHRGEEEEYASQSAPAKTRAGQPGQAAAPALSLQRTLGNAAFRRYLQGDTERGPASGLISRDSAKEKLEQAAPVAVNKYSFFMTMTDDKGKQIPGPVKRKGREGQFELLSFKLDNSRSNNPTGRVRDSSQNTKYDGDTTTVSTDGVVSFSFIKRADIVSPQLMQMLNSGQHVIMHIEMVMDDTDGKESVTLMADMKDVLLTGYQLAGTDNDKDRSTLENITAETTGMVTVLNAMAGKAAEKTQKKPIVEPEKRK